MFPVMSAGNPITGYNINNSLRFRASASAYLSRTPTTPTNSYIWTYSAWFKRGTLGVAGTLLEAYGAGNNTQYGAITITSADVLTVSGWSTAWRTTTQVFRDPSAWYHLVVAVDTTQTTGANRVKVYLNGNQVTAFGTSNDPTQNTTVGINTAVAHSIGSEYSGTRYQYFDGYMAEQYFVDGQALTPSSFGSTDAITGQWLPKQYSSTYGTNGFYLKFADASAATAAAIGKDSSGNGNNWTPSGISVTAGVTYDAMLDSPTLTSATVGNYATLNAVNQSSQTFSNANLTTSASTVGGNRSTIGMSSGKWYWEVSPTTCPNFTVIGIISASVGITADLSASNGITYLSQTGAWWRNNVGTTYGASYTTTDVIGVAVDIDNNTITFYKNNVSQGAITSVTLNTDTWFATMGNAGASAFVGNFNFGQRPFSYTPPTGYVALNTYNLPTPTIKAGNKYMDATLYTGNSTTVTATNAGTFKPDLVWIKDRTSVSQHVLTDSVRGTSAQLFSSLTNAEQTNSTYVTSFNTNGFTVGVGTAGTGVVNNTGDNFVGWQWQAGQGSTSSNTSGSITSTVSVNTTAGFSVATFTIPASGTTFTVGHGLGVAPKFVAFKTRSGTSNWLCQHTSTGTQYIMLNSTAAATTDATIWNSAPTSSVVNFGTSFISSYPSNTAVMYCWAEIAGFSKFGSYTGNGSADGTFVYLGFRPKFIMIKSTATANSWHMTDTSRSTYNTAVETVWANESTAESTSATNAIDILSNGFKVRNTTSETNNAGTMIYMAFAENPFKHANAR